MGVDNWRFIYLFFDKYVDPISFFFWTYMLFTHTQYLMDMIFAKEP